MNLWKISDYAGLLICQIDRNRNDIPPALPWVEPSINNLYLEACSSFLYGNYFSSILTASLLLEHTLRLALVNKDRCGLNRCASAAAIDRYGYLSNLLDQAAQSAVFAGCNEQWWRDSAKYIRNKTAHYLLPVLLRNCIEIPSFADYFDPELKKENFDSGYYNTIITDWGAFYHRADRRFAKHFLRDVFKELAIVIGNTNWTGDTSWWISQKDNYDRFFNFDWSYDHTLQCMQDTVQSL